MERRGLPQFGVAGQVVTRRPNPQTRRTSRFGAGPGRLRDAPAGYGGVVTDAISAVPGADHWSYGPFEFDHETGRRTVPLVRDDGTTAAFTIPEFVSEPGDLQAIAHIVIAACERWENREGVGG